MIYLSKEENNMNANERRLEEERKIFIETLATYTDYNLVSFMHCHNVNKPNNKTNIFIDSFCKGYADMIYEECLKELKRRKSELLKEVYV